MCKEPAPKQPTLSDPTRAATVNVLGLLSGHQALRRRRPKGIKLNVRERCSIDGQPVCVVCRRPTGSPLQLELAHLDPVEEGGKFEVANLILLCRRQLSSVDALLEVRHRGRSIEDVGCHQLFDYDGAWSRADLLDLARTPGNLRAQFLFGRHLSRPTFKPSRRSEVGELVAQIETRISWHRSTNDLFARLDQKTKTPHEALQAGLLKLRAFRRGLYEPPSGEQEIRSTIHNACTSLNDTDSNDWADYEVAMAHFALREFCTASELLKRAESRGEAPGKWLINAAQARVAEFEAVRRHAGDETCRRIRDELAALVSKIDDLERDRGSDARLRRAIRTWPTTAKLHLARMSAHLKDVTVAADYLQLAKDDRDHRLQARLWEDPGDYRPEEYDRRDGWSRYSAVLLLHARGEVLRAAGDYAAAVEVLSLAARRIIIDRYKNYEYLENVWEGLLNVPRGRVPLLDRFRSSLSEWYSEVFGWRPV